MSTTNKLTIGFIGNFDAPHSTENERKWSFERLGHTVVPFQENKTTATQLLEAMNALDMLMYSHTHDPSYVISNLINVFNIYKANKVPTVSCHLDRWLGLKRVEDVGKEATWKCEYIFMADASPEAIELYNKHNLNWYYLKPAVVERACYMTKPLPAKFPYEIVFTGSKGYHPEYPFRPQLIDFLHRTYGNKFGHFGNDGIRVIRGAELNELYASAKIVVGDSCFGGRPNYSSDRLTEVVGRGGFIIVPNTETLGIPVETFNYPDLQDLKNKIDFWTDPLNEKERKKRAIIAHEHVKKHHTYTNRAEEIIEVVFSKRLSKHNVKS